MTLSARPDKGCVDDGEFCILQQLLTKKKLLNIGETEDIQLPLQQRLLCNNQSSLGLVVNFTMGPKHVTIF